MNIRYPIYEGVYRILTLQLLATYTFAIVFLLLLIVFHNFLITSRIFSSCGEVLPRKRKQTMSLHFVTLSNPVSNCR